VGQPTDGQKAGKNEEAKLVPRLFLGWQRKLGLGEIFQKAAPKNICKGHKHPA
jgi:hypothetical protein